MAPATPVEAWDEVFIRTSRRRVNALVTDPAIWPGWWRGCAVDSRDGLHHVTLTGRWPLPARQRLDIRLGRVRPRDKGVELTVTGDVEGDLELFHLDGRRGVVVNYLLRATRHGRLPRVWLAAHRGIVRAGLTALKDRLEGGLPPGAEPHPDLLAHQAEELEIFAQEVAAHEAKKAAAGEG